MATVKATKKPGGKGAAKKAAAKPAARKAAKKGAAKATRKGATGAAKKATGKAAKKAARKAATKAATAATKKAAAAKAAAKKAGKKAAGAARASKKPAAAKKPAATKAAASKSSASKSSASKSAATKAASSKAGAKGRGPASNGGPTPPLPARADGFRIKVRMYRQGLGDCFLITLPRAGSERPYFILIDCGVILGTKDPQAVMTRVVEDVIRTTGGRLDLVVATHEHWDHISGFLQARELWEGREADGRRKLEVDEVWLAWSEDPADELARRLGGERHGMRLALAEAATHLRVSGDSDAADEVTGLLEFFGAAGGRGTTADALEIVRNLSPNLRFCRPADAPFAPAGTGVNIYVLGPPPDEKFLKRYKPSTKHPETYGHLAAFFLDDIRPALSGDPAAGAPFDKVFQIPLAAAEQVPFFREHYWGEDADSEEKDQGWRRIAGSWLDSSSALALQLDSATNNTSLVLAFELDGGEVLLFASDAQVGNWLSWQELRWDVGGRKVTGPDLLGRTVFYKVGHHGSHNATLKELGLEQMGGLELAFMPVDHEMAVKKSWGKIPLNDLLDRLNEVTKGRVVRIDEKLPAAVADKVTGDALFYEVVF